MFLVDGSKDEHDYFGGRTQRYLLADIELVFT
jgi:hypothetical protein